MNVISCLLYQIEQDWDVINADNELDQLKVHFERGGVGASLYMDASSTATENKADAAAALTEEVASLQDRNESMEARIAELEHELSYADKARVNAEQRNAHLCASNAALAEEAHSLTATLLQVKKDMEGVESEKRNLEKSTVQLENFVEETINNSQSGYNFLCEARERVTDITRELMGLRNFLGGADASAMVVDESSIGFRGGVLQAVMSDLNVTLSLYKETFADVSLEVRRLKSVSASPQPALVMPPAPPSDGKHCCNKIALSNFSQGDVAMFFPTPKGDYVAFNIGTPHHYLSEESKALIGHDPHFKKVYVLGRIIIKEEKVAPDVSPPFNLKPGTNFFEISVESIAEMFPAPAMKGSNHKFRDEKKNSSSYAAVAVAAPTKGR
jgi:hypothetical protein